jgi:hypothetical protein
MAAAEARNGRKMEKLTDAFPALLNILDAVCMKLFILGQTS